MDKKLNRADECGPQAKTPRHLWLRPGVQIGFVIFSILLGLQFRSFVLSLAGPDGSPIRSRPAAVDVYLPISSMMSLTYWMKSGIANHVHPAGLVLFTLTLILALLLRRGFCSWVCPIGTLSEWAHKTSAFLFGRCLTMPKWLDLPLRSLKFLLLGFFLYSIVLLPTPMLRQFIEGSYNRIADLKMYQFFADISQTALMVIIILGLLSLVFKNFLCRYLCPYGALLGLLSALSPFAVRRDTKRCTDCGHCTRACPHQIAVDKKIVVRSLECTSCFSCVEVCPTAGALRLSWPISKRGLSWVTYGFITIATFFFAAQISRVCHYWQSDTPPDTYKTLYHQMHQIPHP